MREQTGIPSGKSLLNRSLTFRSLLMFILLATALGFWWTAYNEDRDLRVHYLENVRMVSRVFDEKHIQELTASDADLASPAYLRIKAQLTGIHQASLRTHFVYLLRQRPDGSIVILADSEPSTSKEYSPPGQVYQEVAPEIRQVFASGREATVGPVSDRWGRWVSAIVPITDPETGRTVALLGMDVAAQDWNRDLALKTAESLALILLFIVPLAVYVMQHRRSEQDLRLSRDEWQNTFDSMPDLIAILDTEHHIVKVNRAMCDKLGQTDSSLIGQHCYRHMHKTDAPPDECPHSKLLKDGDSHTLETHLPDLNGHYSVTATPLHDAAGNLTGSIHIAHDVTVRKQMEEALRDSEERYRMLFNEALIGIGMADAETGILIDCNEALAHMTGRSPGDLIGSHQTSLHPPSKNSSNPTTFIQHLNEAAGRVLPDQIITASGELRDVEIKARTFVFHDRPILLGTFNDITERKLADAALQESKEHYKDLYRLIRLMCDNVPDLIWAKDLDQRYIFANRAMCDILLNAEDPEEPVGKNDMYFAERERATHPEQADWHTFGEFCMDSDTLVMTHQSAQRFDESGNVKGTQLFLDVSKAPFLDEQGTMIGTVGCGRDVTRVKQMEESLNRKNAEIEQFIYTVSHDLRSPLVTVKTFLGYLEQDISTGDSERISKDMEFMHTAADRMEILLNELLDMSRIGRVTVTHDVVSFQELATEALDALAGQISTDKARVQVSGADPSLCGDRRRLLQIWQNLLDNALKYMGDQASPRIEIGVEELAGETVFFVRDNGIGIAPQYHEKVFGIFEQLDRQITGVGMGLTMVRRIVEIYGGRIWVESDGEGQGSCFRFTLPGAVKGEG